MRRALIVAAPLVVVLVLALWRALGPAPAPLSAPPSEFSSARAMSVLRDVVGTVPHPIATPANHAVRDRVMTRFRALGYATEIQSRFACNAGAMCGVVENVIARAPGAQRGDSVLLVAHYDSVPAGPGASDDGMGVATLLEVARAIRGERFHNPVVFLVDDGEEAGLLGAEAFVADDALAREASVVVNIENRGTYGASNMFETSRGNRWLIRHFASSAARPMASSLFYAIYDALPNDTDVTVFKRAGKAAVNFAAIRGVNRYHTPLDDLAHASPRTLQHHGDNVLAMTRALANADLAARSGTDATYFDVLGFFLVWWPQEWTLWIAVASLALLIIGARKSPARAMTFGVLTTFVAIVLAIADGSLMAWLLRLREHDMNWVAYPAVPVAAMWLTGIASAIFAASFFVRRSGALPMIYGNAIVWHAIGIALALTVPGASFIFIVPAVAVTICALTRAGEIATATIAATVGAIVFFPFGILLYDALGERLIGLVAVAIGIFATLAAPLFADKRIGTGVIVTAVVCAIVASVLPVATSERPHTLNMNYVDDPNAPSAQWVTWDLTAPLRAAAHFAKADASLTPWNRGDAWAAAAPGHLERVTLAGERRGNDVIVRVRTNRHASRLVLLFRGGAVKRVNGTPLPPRPARWRDHSINGWNVAVANGVDEMVVEIAANTRIEAVASDVTFGLPPTAAPLLRARTASTAVPIHEGDNTITRARGSW